MSGYSPGEFCWAELVTSDEGESLPFYKDLLGITEETLESEDGSAYYMLKAKSDYVFGMYEASESRSHWTSYICVKNAEKITKEVEKLGGFVEQDPMQVMDAGTFATFVDVEGASFSVWQPGHHKGATAPRSATGMFGWHELVTNDATKAAKFYSELFGWKSTSKKTKDGIYMIMTQGSVQICGIKEMPDELDDAPPHWLIYFNVKDCDKAIDKVEELGGSVFHKPLPIPSVGQYTVARDPAGAIVGLVASAGKKSTAKAKTTKSAGTKKKSTKKTSAKD